MLVVLTSERESLSLPPHNSNSHPLKQEFPKPFIQCNKRCKEILLMQLPPELNRLPLGEHPWSLASEELWQLSCGICQPLCSHIPVMQKPFGREWRRISLPGDFHSGADVEGNECVAQSGSHCLGVDTFPEPV